jgi:hypothetical protein
MGNKFTVEVWCEDSDGYFWDTEWQGESFVIALWQLIKAKRLGCGCTRLMWR